MNVAIDRSALDRLLKTYPKAALAREFGISLPTLRAVIAGHTPHQAIVEKVQREIVRLLA